MHQPADELCQCRPPPEVAGLAGPSMPGMQNPLPGSPPASLADSARGAAPCPPAGHPRDLGISQLLQTSLELMAAQSNVDELTQRAQQLLRELQQVGVSSMCSQ